MEIGGNSYHRLVHPIKFFSSLPITYWLLPILYVSLKLGVALSSSDVWLIMLIFDVLGSLTER